MSKHAVILAGGKGARLHPYTIVIPKPLVPIGAYPVLEIILKQLAMHEFENITLAVNHQADLIKAYFGNGQKWNVNIEYSLEDKPMSTMGPLKLIDGLPNDFLVMNGDILTDMNFSEFHDYHLKSKNIFTSSSFIQEHNVDYGVIKKDADGNILNFEEKPSFCYEVSMGIYMVNKATLDFIPDDVSYGFDELMLDFIKAGKLPEVKQFNGYWLDIGRPADYAQAIDEFENIKDRLFK